MEWESGISSLRGTRIWFRGLAESHMKCLLEQVAKGQEMIVVVRDRNDLEAMLVGGSEEVHVQVFHRHHLVECTAAHHNHFQLLLKWVVLAPARHTYPDTTPTHHHHQMEVEVWIRDSKILRQPLPLLNSETKRGAVATRTRRLSRNRRSLISTTTVLRLHLLLHLTMIKAVVNKRRRSSSCSRLSVEEEEEEQKGTSRRRLHPRHQQQQRRRGLLLGHPKHRISNPHLTLRMPVRIRQRRTFPRM